MVLRIAIINVMKINPIKNMDAALINMAAQINCHRFIKMVHCLNNMLH